jgi:hypothetical protein
MQARIRLAFIEPGRQRLFNFIHRDIHILTARKSG